MIINIAPNFYSALSLPYDLQVKVTDLEIVCESFTSKFLRSFIYSATSQIILFIFGIQIAAVHMKCHALLPLKKKKFKMLSAAALISILRVNKKSLVRNYLHSILL